MERIVEIAKGIQAHYGTFYAAQFLMIKGVPLHKARLILL